MKVEYFLRKYIWYVEKYGVIGGPCPAVSFKSSQVSSAWIALYSVYRVGGKYQVRNFGLHGSA